MKRILIFILLAFAATANARNHSEIGKSLKRHDSLIAYWDFSTKEHALRAKGCAEELVLLAKSEDVKPEFVDEGKEHSLYFDGGDYLYIPYRQTGSLNVRSNAVTVIARVKWTRGKIGFVAGMWDEYANGGMRQYGLFISLPYYNGKNQVCGHISRTGRPTPPFPYSIDYSASAQEVPDGEWCTVAFTYDGKYIRSYFNGEFQAREPELISHTKGFDGYPEGLVQSKNPYYFPDGIGDNGSDFTVGAVFVKGKIGNHFKGNISWLAIYDRALTESEISRLSK